MSTNKRVLEALQVQPLSEEEKVSKHILGRLYGPISTWSDSTRNDRFYNKPLWVKALNDEIFKEKISTRSLFLELGHPADREETDMTKICACIPEMPKIVDNDLCAYVDILDTPNGRLLKTLIDYGFIPGISSRGSGDVDENNTVDPETFFLETWDIVQLPAVKKARLTVCESLDGKKATLKKALTESLKSASEEDREIMKETLDNLDINLSEDAQTLPGGTPMNVADIPTDDADPEENKILTEEAEEPEVTEEETEEIDADIVEDNPEEDSEDDNIEENDVESEETEEEPQEEDKTVGDLVKELKTFDKKAPVKLEPIEIEGTEYDVKLTDAKLADDEETVKIGVDCQPVTGDSEYIDEPEVMETSVDGKETTGPETEEIPTEDVNAAEEGILEEPEVTEEEAIDNGDDEVIESLKEMIRQKDALEKKVKILESEKSVGGAKEKELQEELTKYKTAFARISELAAKATKYEATVKELTEQVTQKNSKIVDLQARVLKSEKLTENVNADKGKVKILTEKLETLQKQSEEAENALKEELDNCKKKLNDRTKVAKTYIAKYNESIQKYVASKASMLGVKPAEITSKLNENYTMADIDKVCDDLLTSTVNISRLPFGRNTRVAIKESKEPTLNVRKNSTDYGYEIDDSLLELAGLK